MPPADPPPQDLGSFDALRDIVAHLRGPQGCPWDRRQSHSSLRGPLLQECYEVLEALDEADPQQLCQELGDLMMNIMLLAQIASEAGEFELPDLFRTINTKLIHRHPHVYGSVEVNSIGEVLHNWDELKREETEAESSALDGVPRHLPALARGQELQRRAAATGFDWEDREDILDKIAEEAAEMTAAPTPGDREEEFGDLLFALANLGRRWNIDSETALRRAGDKFRRRFSFMEELCKQRGFQLQSLSPEEQNALWDEAKRDTGA
ncbi:MAG: nucleoside triphosphate pyrophosphohydrolase [Dehalococcoidia bacterium]